MLFVGDTLVTPKPARTTNFVQSLKKWRARDDSNVRPLPSEGIRSDEMTRFIYALKEIRACLEAEILTDVQQRLVLLSQDMDNHNGHNVIHQPTFPRS